MNLECRIFALVLITVCAIPSIRSVHAQSSPEELLALFPMLNSEQIRESALPGFYEIHFGIDVGYISADGRYLLEGRVIDMMTGVNLTERRHEELRAQMLAEADESRMIIFSPPNPRYTITVFTDVDCPYCRLLQAEIDELLALDIRVRYLFYPRTGPNTESWFKAQNVWCAPDRHDALTRGMRGEHVPDRSCATPVEEHYRLGRTVGLAGTPMILAENGREIGGYLEPLELLNRLRAILNE